jgi:uncharacterized protein (UPF0210 family)
VQILIFSHDPEMLAYSGTKLFHSFRRDVEKKRFLLDLEVEELQIAEIYFTLCKIRGSIRQIIEKVGVNLVNRRMDISPILLSQDTGTAKDRLRQFLDFRIDRSRKKHLGVQIIDLFAKRISQFAVRDSETFQFILFTTQIF